MPSLETILLTVSLTLLSCFGTTFSSTAPAPSIEASTSLADTWKYNRTIIIDNQGDKASHAVVLVELNAATFDYADAKADGADIRFTTTSGSSGEGLPYWIEQWNERGVSRVWVKVPMLAGHGKTALRMRYGNPDARAVSQWR